MSIGCCIFLLAGNRSYQNQTVTIPDKKDYKLNFENITLFTENIDKEENKSINFYLKISSNTNINIDEHDKMNIKITFPEFFAEATGFTSAKSEILPKKISKDQSLQVPIMTYLVPADIYENLEIPKTLKITVYLNDQLFAEEDLDVIIQNV